MKNKCDKCGKNLVTKDEMENHKCEKEKSMSFKLIVQTPLIMFGVLIVLLMVMERDMGLESLLENEYEAHDMKINLKEDISLAGYPNRTCSKNLKVEDGSIGRGVKPVVEYYEGKVYIANFIKEHAAKKDVEDYILACVKEIKEKKEKAKKNTDTWK